MRPSSASFPLFAVALVALLSGCSKSRGTVSGKVTLGETPIVYGSVILVGADNQPLRASISPDGRYEIKDVPYGSAKAAVISPDPNVQLNTKRDLPPRIKDLFKDKKIEEAPPPAIDVSKWFAIPESYASVESSGLTLTVNQKNVTYDIALK